MSFEFLDRTGSERGFSGINGDVVLTGLEGCPHQSTFVIKVYLAQFV
ncbi:hypothetical protein MYX65_03970 [Acidobacteria bacterium AH-259-L09]|nr:hypothetical protein [Acidobacteria bacterium AH-259-L09]